MAPRFHALLEAYGARSGVPVLLNTSFNLAGEPIVNRAVEGYSTFRRCGIDVLVAGRRAGGKSGRAAAESAARRCSMIKRRGKLCAALIVLASAPASHRGPRARALAQRAGRTAG